MTRARTLVAICPAIGALATVAMLITGVTLDTAILLVLAVAWQCVAGAIIWRRLHRGASDLEILGMAIALGTLLASLAGAVSAALHLGPWGWAVPSIIALGWRALSRGRGANTDSGAASAAARVDRWALLGLAAALIPGLALWGYALRLYPLTWSGSWSGYHPDMPFFEALGHSVAQFGPFTSPFLPGALVRYHWLAYAWQGQLEVSVGAEPFVALTRLLPLVALVGCAAIASAWARQLSPNRWVPALAGLLLATGGFTGAVFGGVLTMDSPSQSISVLWLFAFVLIVTRAVRSSQGHRTAVLLVTISAFALMGAKVSAGAPALAGVVVLALGTRSWPAPARRRAWHLLGATAIGCIGGFVFFLVGATGGGGLTIGALIDRASSQQGMNPTEGALGVLLGTLLLALAVLPRWAGLAWLITQRPWRAQPEVLLGCGLALSSVLALLAFNSFNELWFSSTVSGPLAVLSAVGVGDALTSMRRGARPGVMLLMAAAAAAIGFALVWSAWVTGASGGNTFVPTWRWAGPLIACGWALIASGLLAWLGSGSITSRALWAGSAVILVLMSAPGRLIGVGTGQVGVLQNGIRDEWFSVGSTPPTVDRLLISAWPQDMIEAAAWIRGNTQPDEVLATNLVHGPLVPGITTRPTFASGAIYQIPYGFPEVRDRMLGHEWLVRSLIDNPTPERSSMLCSAGVGWLWVSPGNVDAHRWRKVATVAQSWPEVSILRLRCG